MAAVDPKWVPCMLAMCNSEAVVRQKGGFLSRAGNFSSFLFQLLPSVVVHTPSGANQNFQYCGHNFASLPNGIGFGGQVR